AVLSIRSAPSILWARSNRSPRSVPAHARRRSTGPTSVQGPLASRRSDRAEAPLAHASSEHAHRPHAHASNRPNIPFRSTDLTAQILWSLERASLGCPSAEADRTNPRWFGRRGARRVGKPRRRALALSREARPGRGDEDAGVSL